MTSGYEEASMSFAIVMVLTFKVIGPFSDYDTASEYVLQIIPQSERMYAAIVVLEAP